MQSDTVPRPNIDASGATTSEQSERDRLVLEQLPLVRSIAVRVYESLPVHVDLDDLVHAGILGLFDAALKYDDSKQVTFQGYAKHRIKGAILDSLRELDWASRDLRKRHKKLEEINREVAASMDRAPTELEIAAKMGMNLERWRQVAVDMRVVGLLSASSRAPDDENQTMPEFPATCDLNPDVLAGKNQLSSVLKTALVTLPARYQQVVHMYYDEGKTMREIGTALGINESRVSQIHRAALEKMQENLHRRGFTPARRYFKSTGKTASPWSFCVSQGAAAATTLVNRGGGSMEPGGLLSELPQYCAARPGTKRNREAQL